MDKETIIRELYAARLIAEIGSQKAEGKIGHLGCVAIKQYLDHAINFLNNKPNEAVDNNGKLNAHETVIGKALDAGHIYR